MKNLKTKITLSCATLLLVGGGAYAYTATQTHTESAPKPTVSHVQQNQKVVALDTVVGEESEPVAPIENGKVNDEFVDRFDDAVTLNSKTGQFEINKSVFPDNASAEEVAEVEKMVNSSNASLKQIIKEVPKDNTVQTGDSVVVANDEKTAQAEAQATQISTMSKYHNGSDYVHVYWWGIRVGISKSTLHTAGNIYGGISLAVGAIGLIPGPHSFGCGVASLAIGVLGFAASNSPGGIVFNCTPPVANVWGVGWQ